MPLRGPYKQWELPGGGKKKSKQTRHSQKQVKLRKLQAVNERLAAETAEEEQVNNSGISHGPVDPDHDCSDTAPDTSTDDEISVSQNKPESRRRRRKRKVRTASDNQPDPIPGSSDEPASLSDSAPDVEDSHSVLESQPTVRGVSPLHDINVLDADCSDDCQETTSANIITAESEPLCLCTNTTVGDVLFMVLSLGLRHGLSWDCQVDILKMMRTVFGEKSIPLSKATFIKKLGAMKASDIEYHVYCDRCNKYLGKRDECEMFCSQCMKVFKNDGDGEFIEKCTDCHIPLEERQVKVGGRTCTNKKCLKEIKFSASENLLVDVSIKSQLELFMKDDKFVNNVMQYRFNRQYIPGVYSDIYDGAMYQKHFVNNGVLSSPYNFSYTFFTDGIPYSKSGKKTVWPIYLTINELPYEERRHYFILAGIYCGSHEPDQQWYFPAFVKQANELSVDGFKWNHNGDIVTSRVIPLCLVADSGARFKLLNMQSYGAYYGCTFCYHLTVQIGGGKYLMDRNSEPAPLRTLASYKNDLIEVEARVNEVQEKNRCFRGVKGAAVLASLRYFSIVESCAVDYFHCILIGVVKRHMDLIFQPCRKHFWNNMKDQTAMDNLIACIDEAIKKIQSNTSVIRELRPLKDIANWKASEFRSWLLFYCIVCLKGFLKEKYLEHLAMLSKAANLLLQKTVTHYHIETAFRLFKLYMLYFQEIFGENQMVYNIHLLSHIPRGVLNFGPLWTHNSFTYESKNRHILQLCKSPHHLPYQVARKFLIYQSLSHLRSSLVKSNHVVTFCDKLLNYKHLVRYDRASDTNCVLLGKPVLQTLSEEDIGKLSKVLECCTSSECFLYDRMYYKKKRYTTDSYGNDKKNNDSYAFLDSGECVKIISIIKYPVGNRVVLYVEGINKVRTPVIDVPDGRFDHLTRILHSINKFIVNIERLDRPCFRIQVRSKEYISSIPYGCTVE